jgi:hypothetical protein
MRARHGPAEIYGPMLALLHNVLHHGKGSSWQGRQDQARFFQSVGFSHLLRCNESCLYLDLAAAAVLRPQVDRTEPTDVLRVVEHPAHHRLLLMHLDRVPREHHLLQDYPVWVAAPQRPCTRATALCIAVFLMNTPHSFLLHLQWGTWTALLSVQYYSVWIAAPQKACTSVRFTSVHFPQPHTPPAPVDWIPSERCIGF